MREEKILSRRVTGNRTIGEPWAIIFGGGGVSRQDPGHITAQTIWSTAPILIALVALSRPKRRSENVASTAANPNFRAVL